MLRTPAALCQRAENNRGLGRSSEHPSALCCCINAWIRAGWCFQASKSINIPFFFFFFLSWFLSVLPLSLFGQRTVLPSPESDVGFPGGPGFVPPGGEALLQPAWHLSWRAGALTLCEQCRNSVRLMAFEFLPICRCRCHSLRCLQPWLFIWKRFVTVPRALLSGGFLQDLLQLSQVLFHADGPHEGQGKLQLVFVSATAGAFAGAPVR